MKETKRIPQQKTGTKTGASVQKITSAQKAKILFMRARKRLFDINNWEKFSGIAGANFWLADEQGNSKQGRPKKGDHIVIDLPGPGPKEGYGYDWVRIEDIQDEPSPDSNREFSLITVRPCAMPGSENNKVAHFYDATATSTFIIERNGEKLISEEKGRNEISNTKKPDSFFDRVRNFFVSMGARAGASQLQWHVLMKNILLKEI